MEISQTGLPFTRKFRAIRGSSGWERMGTLFPGPLFLQSGVFRPRRALFLWKRMLPARKDSFIHGNATNKSEFDQDNGLTRNAGAAAQRKGYTDFYRARGCSPLALP